MRPEDSIPSVRVWPQSRWGPRLPFPATAGTQGRPALCLRAQTVTISGLGKDPPPPLPGVGAPGAQSQEGSPCTGPHGVSGAQIQVERGAQWSAEPPGPGQTGRSSGRSRRRPARSVPKGAERVGATPGMEKAQEVPDTPCSHMVPDTLFLDKHSVAGY